MKILAVGMNYAKHNKELGGTLYQPEEPVIFAKPDSALLKDGKPFFIPDFTKQCDYEVELVVRICRLGKNISPRFAHRYYDAVTVGIDFTAGLKNVLNSDYEYYRLELSIKHDFDIAPIGYSDVLLSGGKIFGRVPYPLLKLHEGNATYFYDPNAFSCMDFYEFASDLWGAVFWEHHFRGFFLGKIPLMKRLKLY